MRRAGRGGGTPPRSPPLFSCRRYRCQEVGERGVVSLRAAPGRSWPGAGAASSGRREPCHGDVAGRGAMRGPALPCSSLGTVSHGDGGVGGSPLPAGRDRAPAGHRLGRRRLRFVGFPPPPPPELQPVAGLQRGVQPRSFRARAPFVPPRRRRAPGLRTARFLLPLCGGFAFPGGSPVPEPGGGGGQCRRWEPFSPAEGRVWVVVVERAAEAGRGAEPSGQARRHLAAVRCNRAAGTGEARPAVLAPSFLPSLPAHRWVRRPRFRG